MDDGQYAKTWITDQSSFDKITPAYIPERFDILGEKLDKAFLDMTETLNPAPQTSYFNDITIGITKNSFFFRLGAEHGKC